MNEINFRWSSVTLSDSACPPIKYKVTAVNCGMCPGDTVTVNTSVTCIFKMNRDQMCTFSVQSVACGNSTGNASSHVTAILRGKIPLQLVYNILVITVAFYIAPVAPEIISILPYYSNKSRNLTKIYVQVAAILLMV